MLFGQLLVTGVFGDLVSKWPYQGSVYAWSRELIGSRFGWMTNWAYMWGLTLTLSVLGLAAAGYLRGAIGINNAGKEGTAAVALFVILCGTTANMIGGPLLRRLLYITVACELIASIGIGTVLLFFHRTTSLSVIFHGVGAGHSPPLLIGPFLGAVALVIPSHDADVDHVTEKAVTHVSSSSVTSEGRWLLIGLMSIGQADTITTTSTTAVRVT